MEKHPSHPLLATQLGKGIVQSQCKCNLELVFRIGTKNYKASVPLAAQRLTPQTGSVRPSVGGLSPKTEKRTPV